MKQFVKLPKDTDRVEKICFHIFLFYKLLPKLNQIKSKKSKKLEIRIFPTSKNTHKVHKQPTITPQTATNTSQTATTLYTNNKWSSQDFEKFEKNRKNSKKFEI